MKLLTILSFLFIHFNLKAEEKRSVHLHLVARVLPIAAVSVVQEQNKKTINIESSSNTAYSSEKQKIYITDMNNNLLAINKTLVEESDGKVRHSVIMKYAIDKATNDAPIIVNVITN
jgi:hypothetical protein